MKIAPFFGAARSIEWMPGAGIDYVTFSNPRARRLGALRRMSCEPPGLASPGRNARRRFLSGAPDQLFRRGRRAEGELQLQSLMASVLIDN